VGCRARAIVYFGELETPGGQWGAEHRVDRSQLGWKYEVLRTDAKVKLWDVKLFAVTTGLVEVFESSSSINMDSLKWNGKHASYVVRCSCKSVWRENTGTLTAWAKKAELQE
jgi:hypothetical protein